MKINIDFLKLIILGSNYEETETKEKQQNDNNSNSVDNSTTTNTSPPPTTQINGIGSIIKNHTNNNITQPSPQKQQPPSTNIITDTNNGIPMIVTSKLVPLSDSFSPSPSSSILTSCSPITFSPIVFSHLNQSLNNSLDFSTDQDFSPPITTKHNHSISSINSNITSTSTPIPQIVVPNNSNTIPSTIMVNNNNNSSTTTTTTTTSSNGNYKTLKKSSKRPPNHHHKHKQRTLFEKLYTESGFNSIKSWYEKNTANNNFIIGESQFVLLLRYLTDLHSYQILNLFDSLDKDDIGCIGFEEFFLLIALLAAKECGQTTKFLYQHSRVMFEIVSGVPLQNSKNIQPNNNNNNNNNRGINNSNNNNNIEKDQYSIDDIYINFDKFCKFGNIIGLASDYLLSYLERFNTVIFDKINFEMFLLFYFVILDEFDRSSSSFHKILYFDPDNLLYDGLTPTSPITKSNSNNNLNNNNNNVKSPTSPTISTSSNSKNSPSTTTWQKPKTSHHQSLQHPIAPLQTSTQSTIVSSSSGSGSGSGSVTKQTPIHKVPSTSSIQSLSKHTNVFPGNGGHIPSHRTVSNPGTSSSGSTINSGITSIPLTLPNQIHDIEDLNYFIDSLKLDLQGKQYIKDQFKSHNILNLEILKHTDLLDLQQIIKKSTPRKALFKALHDPKSVLRNSKKMISIFNK
ncbi:hypothetical protein DLAC_08634 [Tieghemostelium lacteum]|uniref:EF-hand domain-containing protein n=1 Tax=Tieghemostelium lacteum TaxID=361077 RepID=A0A151Z7V5_TIELA|nr:hypothetical protein DLAC_08634 [Tieghemostelium lacteum]|eukprot:KYQ90049.1 hypothetical protein DLAC_08634 [Tieghemostelium lacteum]